MNETMQHILKNILGSVVRAALVFAGAWLVKKGVVTDEQAGIYVTKTEPVLIGALLTVASLAWAAWQKKKANEKVDKALAAPPMSRAEFEKTVDKGVV